MNHTKQVYKAISALVAAEHAQSPDEAVKAIKKFAKASTKLAKAHYWYHLANDLPLPR